MKTRKIFLSLVLLLSFLLAACKPQATPTETINEKEMTSANASDTMNADEVMMEDNVDEMVAEEDMVSDQDDEMMAEDEDMMSDTDGMVEDDDMMADEEDDMASDHDDEMMAEDDMVSDTDEMVGAEDESMADDVMMGPDWFHTTLTNARTGEAFTISDFKGKVVLVETMAIWCSNCFKQQGEVYALHKLISDRENFVSLGIDIDPNENAEALKTYITDNGFTWLYTVAPTEVAREIGQLYGTQFLNPPSTPMLIIDRQGDVHPLPFGIKSAETLLEALQPFLDTEM